MITFLFFSLMFNCIYCWPTFYLYSQKNPTNGIPITSILNTQFSKSLQTKFIIHGFGSSYRQPNLVKIKDELIKKEYLNVIIVDWEEGAKQPNYLNAINNAKITGKKVGEFIKNNNIDPKTVHCIGHSLGAQACGFAGKVTKIKRISGLDPAGPGFKGQPIDNRLDKSDADFVDIVHSDVLLGIQDPIGHKDFYPNGGTKQPGCENSSTKLALDYFSDRGSGVGVLSCSHSRSIEFYAESINSRCLFVAKPCASYDKLNECSCTLMYGCSQMGYYADRTKENGKFYLNTGRETPFCI